MASNFPAVPMVFPLIKTPIFRTIIINYGGKAEQRIALDSIPRYKIQINFENLTPTDYLLILNHFIECKGAFDSFIITDENGTQYTVRYEQDSYDFEYFKYLLYNLKAVAVLEVNA